MSKVRRSLRGQGSLNTESDSEMDSIMHQCSAVNYWDCEFEDPARRYDPEVKARCLDSFNHHMARVQQVIPADRLLVFNFSDGWPPLASFLNRTIPDEEFPYTDHFTSHGTSFLQENFLVQDRTEL
eukprot:gb/GFBE01041634.1/.p1 GENE.gb/GFBE01041634.1/~~gb/GFBE01041634.1/.p1  ORF type:complete len:126 (+),score=15.75 gb/GFBE01041634.1/:1-378(+)